jgi:hypothetical protein
LPTNTTRDDTPVAEAVVFLAYDDAGHNAIEGYEARTGSGGSYSIDTKGLPKSQQPDGVYYLVVKKPGYQTIVQRIGIGPMSHFVQNTVILKPVPVGEEEGR